MSSYVLLLALIYSPLRSLRAVGAERLYISGDEGAAQGGEATSDSLEPADTTGVFRDEEEAVPAPAPSRSDRVVGMGKGGLPGAATAQFAISDEEAGEAEAQIEASEWAEGEEEVAAPAPAPAPSRGRGRGRGGRAPPAAASGNPF